MTRTTKQVPVVALMRLRIVGLATSAVLAFPLWALTDPVRTTSGPASGSATGAVRIYRGIPYAAAPVGNLRWRPPEAVKSWTSVRAATEAGPDCVQASMPGSTGSPSNPQSEDCLFLNVVTPARMPTDKLPVMVWIHGGGFMGGTGASDFYRSEPLSKRGVVLVTLNYRLNVFGFLAHSGLTAESKQHSSGNYGLLDQIAALKWVKANIAAFGGDPARVTIFGVSAGGSAVCRLIVSPLAKGLFHRAIVESAGREFRPLQTLSEAEKLGRFWGEDITQMRAVQADDLKRKLTLVSAGAPVGPTDAPRFFWAIVDGWVVSTEQVYNTGNLNAVPLIIGHNEDEMELFFRRAPPTNLADYRAYVRRWFREAEAKVLTRYPASSDSEAHVAFQKLLGDTEFNYAAGATALAMSRWQKVFRYHFTRARGSGKVATHADEVPYIFGKLDLPFFGLPAGTMEPVDEKLSE